MSQNTDNQSDSDRQSHIAQALNEKLSLIPLYVRFLILGLIILMLISLSGYIIIRNSQKSNPRSEEITPTPPPAEEISTTPGAFFLPVDSPTPTQIPTITPTAIPHTPTTIPANNTPIPPTSTLIPPTNTPVPSPTPTPQPPSLNGFYGPYTGWSSPYTGSPGGVCFVVNNDNLVNPNGGIVTWEFSWQLDSGGWSSWSVQHAIYCFGSITGSHTVRVKPRIEGWNEGAIATRDF